MTNRKKDDMSNVPEVDLSKVVNRYATKLSETEMQLFQVEAIAESLMIERDAAVAELEEYKANVESEATQKKSDKKD